MFIGAAMGFVAVGVAVVAWHDVLEQVSEEYLDPALLVTPVGIPDNDWILIALIAGSALAAFVGGIAGACLDWLVDRRKGED